MVVIVVDVPEFNIRHLGRGAFDDLGFQEYYDEDHNVETSSILLGGISNHYNEPPEEYRDIDYENDDIPDENMYYGGNDDFISLDMLRESWYTHELLTYQLLSKEVTVVVSTRNSDNILDIVEKYILSTFIKSYHDLYHLYYLESMLIEMPFHTINLWLKQTLKDFKFNVKMDGYGEIGIDVVPKISINLRK